VHVLWFRCHLLFATSQMFYDGRSVDGVCAAVMPALYSDASLP
jgi:hypothetical protein